MATYIVGDIQGCFPELQSLLELVNFNAQRDELWLAGDLVARGPQSLETLRFVKNLGESAKIVLGNHDLHLLAVSLGYAKQKKKDLTAEIFTAPDCQEILDWLRRQPLIRKHPEHGFIMVHAGISPQWTPDQAIELAQEVHQVLASPQYSDFFANMYGNHPTYWTPDLTGFERLRFIVNVLTRMRYCYQDGSLDFANKQPPLGNTNEALQPWFDVAGKHVGSVPILFGHWAALMGKTARKDVIGLDTGCVWGNRLTMLRWDDQQLFSLPSMKVADAHITNL
ncbi:symmetrical bis(5'-nucleosyl)-tetraphosphatase [Motilimonas cestriensis]|uniref:symmetrical bis(5'-nucleosyl)-tetraphosphatase n=1 Tax=Motilimonas cestriensis TaxID=2742685 RepID=UPI003DA31699